MAGSLYSYGYGDPGSPYSYDFRDPGPHFHMNMGTRGPQSRGSPFSHDNGPKINMTENLDPYLLQLLKGNVREAFPQLSAGQSESRSFGK